MPTTAANFVATPGSINIITIDTHSIAWPKPEKSINCCRSHSHSQRTPRTQQVLETTELLEAILLQLPIRDVLLFQSVSKYWHSTITFSISLQRALFLRPVSPPKNPKFAASRRIHFIDLSTPWHEVLTIPSTTSLFTSILPLRESLGSTFTLTGRLLPMSTQKQAGSWRNMLLAQPPRNEEHFIGNCTNVFEPACENQMSFHSARPCEPLWDGAARQHGKLFGLGAIRIKHVGGVTMADFAEALALESTSFEMAELKACKYNFGWAGHDTIVSVMRLWEDIKAAQDKRLIAFDENENEIVEKGEHLPDSTASR